MVFILRKPVFGVSGRTDTNKALQTLKLIEACNFCLGSRGIVLFKSSVYLQKTKVLITYTDSLQLICVFVFA